MKKQDIFSYEIDAIYQKQSFNRYALIFLQYHEEKDATRYCALSRVHRLSFLLADHFCKPLGVNLVAGQHLPMNADLSNSMLSLPSELSVRTKRTLFFCHLI